jgi:hypothetical protein
MSGQDADIGRDARRAGFGQGKAQHFAHGCCKDRVVAFDRPGENRASRSFMSAAAIGGIGKRRGQQRDVIVPFCPDAEIDGNHVEEGRIGQRRPCVRK